MWFVLILESQDGKNGSQEERQHGGLHSHTLGRERVQGLLNHSTNRTQGHHLTNGGTTCGEGELTLPRGAALVVLPLETLLCVCQCGGPEPGAGQGWQ